VTGAAALVPLAGLWLLAAAMPGPNTLLVGHRAARDGWAAAAAAACGTATGTLVWSTAALFGLSLLFAAAPQAQTAIRVAGGLYLAWTGIALWRSAGEAAAVSAARPSRLGAFRDGLLTNLSNPKSAAFATSLLAASLPPDASPSLRVAAVATVVSVSLGWYLLVARSVSHPRIGALYLRGRRTIARLAGGLFVLFGLKLAFDR
jgi:threonine efflux protein